MRIQRAQLTPADTNAAVLYKVGEKVAGSWSLKPTGEGVVRVCHTGSSIVTFRLFHHRQGETQSTATALYYDESLGSVNSKTYPVAALLEPGESLSVRSSVADELTFTYESD